MKTTLAIILSAIELSVSAVETLPKGPLPARGEPKSLEAVSVKAPAKKAATPSKSVTEPKTTAKNAAPVASSSAVAKGVAK